MGKDIAEFRSQGHEHQRPLNIGGVTRNELWNQIKAGVLQSTVELSEDKGFNFDKLCDIAAHARQPGISQTGPQQNTTRPNHEQKVMTLRLKSLLKRYNAKTRNHPGNS